MNPRLPHVGPPSASIPPAACGPHLAAPGATALPEAAITRLLHHLEAGERCVSDLAGDIGTKLSTLSQQLRLLHAERIVARRREGKHIYYTLADDHVRALLRAALDHAGEARTDDDAGAPEELTHDP
jgi:ArsR family transcriptional regulator